MRTNNTLNRIIKAGIREIFTWFDFIFSYFPGITGVFLRKLTFKIKTNKSGKNITIGIGLVIKGGEGIRTGENISIMRHCSLYAHNDASISLGNN
jgi:acetyltransferase-like isoleucine patch superfamily enzyme